MRALLLTIVIMAITDPITLLSGSAAEAWLPAPRPVRSEWCTENIRLPSETGAQPGRFDLDDHAYLQGLLDAVDDPEIRKIVFVGATQIGKTELIKAICLSQG